MRRLNRDGKRPRAAWLLALLVAAATATLHPASGNAVEPPTIEHAGADPSGHYVDAVNDEVQYFDAATGLLYPTYITGDAPPVGAFPDDPGFDPGDPWFVPGQAIRFFEFGEDMDPGLATEACADTFCVTFDVKRVGNWSGTWEADWRGFVSGFETPLSEHAGELVLGSTLGLVSGGRTYFNQSTVATNCEVDARMKTVDQTTGAIDPSEGAFVCVG